MVSETVRNKLTLGDLVNFKRGYDLPHRDRENGAVPIISSSGLTGWHKRSMAKAPGVITGRYGTLGEVFYVEEDYWPLNTSLYVQDFKRNNPKFIYYYLKTVLNENFNSAGAVPGVNRNYLHKIKVPPAPRDQKKIAATLSAYDDLIENNKRRIALLENMAEEIYREWFVRFRFPGYQTAEFEKGIPKGWEEIAISDVVDFKSGFAFKSEKYEVGERYGIVTIKNVHDGTFFPECSDHIAQPPSNLPKHCFINTGDILMSLTGNVGRVCIAHGDDLLLNQRVVLLKPKHKGQSHFIYWLFRQKSMMMFCEMISTGAAQQNLSPIKLGAQKVIYPGSLVIEKYQKIIEPIISKIMMLLQENNNLTTSKNMLLPRLISGKLSVEDLDIQFPPSMQNTLTAR